MQEQPIPLAGGRTGGAVRVGDTVRRSTGPWTPAVHALLAHLRERGIPAVPLVIGLDQDQETLSYLPGTVHGVDVAEPLNRAQLCSLGAWMRLQHSAAADFAHDGPWRFFGAEDIATIVTHNDLGPTNLCFAGDRLSGVFDWDLAGPSTPLLDLAWAAWSNLDVADVEGFAAGVAALVAGYEPEPGPLGHLVLDTLPRRMTIAAEGIPQAVRRGDEAMRALLDSGAGELIAAARDDLIGRLPHLHAALARC